jgi:hypothetical protein
LLLGAAAAAFSAGCDDDEDMMAPPTPTSFTVTVENVSQPNTLNTIVLGGAVPLSPGVWAVFTGANPAFTSGADASAGTELLAEDGVVTVQAQALQQAANVSSSGTFEAPAGTGPPIEPGETATFTIEAVPGDRLTLQTMFVQSNDYFYAFDGQGIELFAGDTPRTGDITVEIRLWDAGTEVDAPLGDPTQKPQQAPADTNIGPDEDEVVQLVSETQPVFTIPAVSAVIRVTITPNP